MITELPILAFTHLQFEAPLTIARPSPNPCDFAPVVTVGLLGLRIFKAISVDNLTQRRLRVSYTYVSVDC